MPSLPDAPPAGSERRTCRGSRTPQSARRVSARARRHREHRRGLPRRRPRSRPARLRGSILTALALLLAPLARAGEPRLGEAAVWLRDYVRIDTSNPPGDERSAAAFLAAILHREGIETRYLVSPGGRLNLYARLASPAPRGGALVLLHHMDVVPPGPGWTGDPFAGEVRDGSLWGRGAIDAKSLGIAHLAAFLARKGEEKPLSRDLVFLAVADEEEGGREGTGWLLERYPELFAGAAGVLNEGGANRVVGGKLRWWGVEVAQKRPLWLRVTARGRAGHGSTLSLHAAPHELVRALARLVDRPLAYRVTPEALGFFHAAARFEPPPLRDLFLRIDRVVADDEARRRLLPGFHAYFLDTVQLNALAGGERVNAIPDEASALVDVRLLPDTDETAFLAELRALAGDAVEIEVLLSAPRVASSPSAGGFFGELERALARHAPVVPAFISGVTDSRYFRQRGIPAYGFSPFALDAGEGRGIHAADERMPLAAFEEGVAVMRRIVAACTGGTRADR